MASTKQARALLEPYLISPRPNANGDFEARCPLHDDKKRSARINFDKGVWVCFATCGGGKLKTLLDRMGEEGKMNGDTSGRRRSSSRSRTPKKAHLTPEMVEEWHAALLADEYALETLRSLRWVLEKSVKRYKIGWFAERGSFTIPTYNPDGSLFDVRLYKPGAPAHLKMRWFVGRAGDEIPLFPHDVLSNKKTKGVVICEGEMDAILCNQIGIPAVSGTAGAKTWKIWWSEQFRGKRVWICYDRDPTGEQAERLVAEYLEPYAEAITIVHNPIDKDGADMSDFIMGDGNWNPRGKKDVLKLLKTGERFDKRSKDPSTMEPIHVSVMDSFNSQNVGRALDMTVLVNARAQEPYSIPKQVHSTCTQDKGPICQLCPMMARGGSHTYEVPAWHQSVLRIIGHPERSQHEALRAVIGTPKCDRITHDVLSHQTVEQLYVRPSWDEEEGDFTPRGIFSVGRHDTMPSQVVTVTGTTWPDPKEQRNKFLAWGVQEAESAIDEFRVTPDIKKQLAKFRPDDGEAPLRKLWRVAQDMAAKVTHIYGRDDLHIAISLIYHSISSFPFLGEIQERGWLDALIVGDTRTGKSEAVQKMAQYYRAGYLVNCEAASFPGIVGGLQQMAGSREWAITWGAIPMNDRRLVVLDEVSGLSYENIAAMSDVRTRGFVRLQKIANEQAWARTRLIWLSNPRDASMDNYTYGVQAIAPLIGNREDIARFDFAMALTQHDVSLATIQRTPPGSDPLYSPDDSHKLIMWAWSRSADDVVWGKGVEEKVLQVAEYLGNRYSSDPPLVQSANVRFKVARIAVAIAAATFSTDGSGKKVVVKMDHVRGALRFLDGLYGKETFGYRRLSEQESEQSRRAIEKMDEAKRWLQSEPQLIRFLQVTEGAFRRDTIEQVMNVSRDEANACVHRFFEYGLVATKSSYLKFTPMLHQLMREIKEER